jgi:cell division protein FtsQ
MYSMLMRELDFEGAHYSADLSEVDLSDSEDVKVVVADPAGAVLVHLGNFDFLRRYKIYLAHLQEWRQQFQKVDSVDLRYEHQIIVNPDSGVHPTNPHPAPAAPHKAAAKPGVAKATGSSETTVHTQAAAGKPAATAQLAKPAATTQPAIPKPAPAQAKKPSPVHKPSPQTATDSRTGTQ